MFFQPFEIIPHQQTQNRSNFVPQRLRSNPPARTSVSIPPGVNCRRCHSRAVHRSTSKLNPRQSLSRPKNAQLAAAPRQYRAQRHRPPLFRQQRLRRLLQLTQNKFRQSFKRQNAQPRKIRPIPYRSRIWRSNWKVACFRLFQKNQRRPLRISASARAALQPRMCGSSRSRPVPKEISRARRILSKMRDTGHGNSRK